MYDKRNHDLGLSIVVALVLTLAACDIQDEKKKPVSRDISTVSSAVVATWTGSLSERKGTTLIHRGQVSLSLASESFTIELAQPAEKKATSLHASGRYFVIGSDRITFETWQSDFGSPFVADQATTMELTLTGDSRDRLQLRVDELEFNLRHRGGSDALKPDGDDGQDVAALHSKCLGLDGANNRWTFQMNKDFSFESNCQIVGKSATMSGTCSASDDALQNFNCLTRSSTEPIFAATSFQFTVTRGDNGAILAKKLTVSPTNSAPIEISSCRG
jgi:hypothetical protein